MDEAIHLGTDDRGGDRDGAAARALAVERGPACQADAAAAIEHNRLPQQLCTPGPRAQEVGQAQPRVLRRHRLRSAAQCHSLSQAQNTIEGNFV